MNRACLKGLDFATLAQNKTGMERETLRVSRAGQVARSPHPAAIGHKLSHPRITVDFSEGLLEFVTGAFARREQMLQELAQLQSFCARSLPADELTWALSMPPSAQESDIQIADFGPSLSGRMKQVYRQGLASRYGKIMQIIAGVHYNFSFDPRFIAHMHGLLGAELSDQECRNRLYFRLIRGFDRQAWLLPYLFGASPIAARSSVNQPVDWLQSLDQEHVFGEFATSLRMSDIGYQSPAQADLNISHRNLSDYVRELVLATRTPWPDYQSLGQQNGDDWVQLNGNILQIENEYYSAIRPKQIGQRGERPACALYNRGVHYIEVRMLDVDPFSALGMSLDTARFMEVFMLSCLALGEDGPATACSDKHNQKLSIRYGRRPDLRLMRGADSVSLREWADEVLDDCAAIAEKLDAAQGIDAYAQAVAVQRGKWQDPSSLPSQKVLDVGQESPGAYADWALNLSARYDEEHRRADLPASTLAALRQEVELSFQDAAQLPAGNNAEFAAYVRQYYASLCGDSLARLVETAGD